MALCIGEMVPQCGIDAVANTALYIGEMVPQCGIDAVANTALYIGEMADAVANTALYIGEMAEWSNAAVSKTVVRLPADRGFESPSLRKDKAKQPPIWRLFLF